MDEERYCKIINAIETYPDSHLKLDFDDVEEESFPNICRIMRRLQNDLPIKIELHSRINIENSNFEVSLEIEKE